MSEQPSAAPHPLQKSALGLWKFKDQDAADDDPWMPVAQVPTQVHLDLLANGKIPDPYLDHNEYAVQWVGEKTWVYRHEFASVPGAPNQFTDLVFEGLDTFATVVLNGKEILKADNMFVSFRVPVQLEASNTLDIIFEPAFLRGRELVKEHSHEHNFLVRQTDVGRLPTRKAQYNWGWDWGPILMTAGPWKPIWRETYIVRIEDVWMKYELSEDLKSCSGTIFVQAHGNLEADDQVTVELESCSDEVSVLRQVFPMNHNGLFEVPFTIESPGLWWPLNYGPQIRHKLSATITRKKESGVTLHSKTRMTGFRRAELIQKPDDHGKSFYFRINNVDVFAGGSCWIPADSFLAQVSSERYDDWVKLAAEGNQVMLRVWGGGVYEDDALIDACDKYGVLLWHDFQFACGSYPAYDSFLKNLEIEARQQIRRLRNHPSMVIWAGNNEDYQVQERYKLDYSYDSDKDPQSWLKSTFPARYLYEHFLPTLVEEEDPGMIYHPSSPWGDGKGTADPSVGDIHQWNIWHGVMNKYQEVRDLGGRFVSEFGMHANPHRQTLHAMTRQRSQLYPGSMVLDTHNKAIGHGRRMMTYIVENFRLDNMTLDLDTYTHLTQIIQADTMRYAYKTWRRDWEARKCGGVLVWQLNDCWPTVSWAIVDYYLIKKPAWYAMKRALQPLDIGVSRTMFDWTQTDDFVDENSALKTGQVDNTLRAKGGTYDIWVVSSKTEDVDVWVETRFIEISSGHLIEKPLRELYKAKANTTTHIHFSTPLPHAYSADSQLSSGESGGLEPIFISGDFSRHIAQRLTHLPEDNPSGNLELDRSRNRSKREEVEDEQRMPFKVSCYEPFVIQATLIIGNKVIARDTAWPEPLKYLNLSDRRVTLAYSERSITITTNKPVKGFVFEERRGIHLSDNGFDIMPDQPVKVDVVLIPSESSSLTPAHQEVDLRGLRFTYVGAEDTHDGYAHDRYARRGVPADFE